MNNRLEDLLYQSGLTAQGCWDEMDDYAKAAVEKFAELLVRECAYTIQEFVDQRIPASEYPSRLKNYFGA